MNAMNMIDTMDAGDDEGEMNTRMRAAYDGIAAIYAVRNAAVYDAIIEYGSLLLTHVGPDARLLDLGCGPGRDAAWLTAHGASVIGADLSAGMLTLARAAIPGRLVQLDMRRLPFTDGAFAGVWGMASLLHLPKAEMAGALREIRRVLIPNGGLVLGLQAGIEEGWEDSPYDTAVQRYFARYQPEEVAALLTTAGFRVRQRGETHERQKHWMQWFAVRSAR